MINHPIRLSLISLLLISGLVACNDHLVPGLTPSRLRIKTLTEVSGDAQLVSQFGYDDQGRLSNIKTQRTDAARQEYSSYVYNNQNQLIQIQRVIHTHLTSDPPQTKNDSYTFSYKAGGQISEIRYTNDAVDSLNFICKPIYNATSQIIGNQVESYNGYQYVQFSTQFIYTNSNITTAQITFLPTNQVSEFPFSYDTNPNPFYGIIMPIATLFLDPVTISPVAVFVYPAKNDGIANLLSLSRNNILSDGYNNYVYTYNSAGLPISRIATRGQFPDQFVTGTLYFDYESF